WEARGSRACKKNPGELDSALQFRAIIVPVKVQIFGQIYSIRGELEEKYVQRLAKFVDEKMHAIAESTGIVDTQKLAVLAALAIPDGTSAKLVTGCGAWLDGPAPMTRNRAVRSRAPLNSSAISLTLPGLTGTGTARSCLGKSFARTKTAPRPAALTRSSTWPLRFLRKTAAGLPAPNFRWTRATRPTTSSSTSIRASKISGSLPSISFRSEEHTSELQSRF